MVEGSKAQAVTSQAPKKIFTTSRGVTSVDEVSHLALPRWKTMRHAFTQQPFRKMCTPEAKDQGYTLSLCRASRAGSLFHCRLPMEPTVFWCEQAPTPKRSRKRAASENATGECVYVYMCRDIYYQLSMTRYVCVRYRVM
jgi:hypothetical protein